MFLTAPAQARSLSAGLFHVCTIRGGQAYCWGREYLGTDPLFVNAFQPAAVPEIAGASNIATNGNDTCAVLSGRVLCRGDGGFGQLGNGATEDAPTFVPVSGITTAVATGTSGHTSCALLAGGEVRCWGRGEDGELGDGGTANSSVPVSTGITNATQVSTGYINGELCAVLATGHVDCWGPNPPHHGSLVPRPVPGITNAKQISVSSGHACALLATGEVVCWGGNGSGQLGNGTTQESMTPVSTGITNAKAVSVAEFSACAVLTDGGVRCWGSNDQGNLGDGTELSSLVPVVTKVAGATSISVGYHGACATVRSGGVACWGSNDYGAVGIGVPPVLKKHYPTPMPVLNGAPAPAPATMTAAAPAAANEE